MKELLKKLSDLDMHVHELTDDVKQEVYAAYKKQFQSPIDTHFIMQGSDIVHIGNLTTIESFVLSK